MNFLYLNNHYYNRNASILVTPHMCSMELLLPMETILIVHSFTFVLYMIRSTLVHRALFRIVLPCFFHVLAT